MAENIYEKNSEIVIMGNAVVEDGAIIEAPCVIKGNSTIKKGAATPLLRYRR
jgi:hypothetical protein